MTGSARARRPRVRMSAGERREQLIGVARVLFARGGLDATSVEEIAAEAQVSKPIVYEHFGGKEGLYAVVVDRELRSLLDGIRGALTTADTSIRGTVEHGVMAWLDYIEKSPDGFRILARGSVVGSQEASSFASILSDVASRVEDLMADAFRERGFDPANAGLYAQALVGMAAMTGQWWLETGSHSKGEVAAHLINLAWNGLAHLEHSPLLRDGAAGTSAPFSD